MEKQRLSIILWISEHKEEYIFSQVCIDTLILITLGVENATNFVKTGHLLPNRLINPQI